MLILLHSSANEERVNFNYPKFLRSNHNCVDFNIVSDSINNLFHYNFPFLLLIYQLIFCDDFFDDFRERLWRFWRFFFPKIWRFDAWSIWQLCAQRSWNERFLFWPSKEVCCYRLSLMLIVVGLGVRRICVHTNFRSIYLCWCICVTSSL